MITESIWIKREVLSDGSHVYNVHIPHLFVPAEDEGAAQRLAEAVRDAVAEYGTGDDVDVKFNY